MALLLPLGLSGGGAGLGCLHCDRSRREALRQLRVDLTRSGFHREGPAAGHGGAFLLGLRAEHVFGDRGCVLGRGGRLALRRKGQWGPSRRLGRETLGGARPLDGEDGREGSLGSLRDPLEFPLLSAPEAAQLDLVVIFMKKQMSNLTANSLRGREEEGKPFPSPASLPFQLSTSFLLI